MSSLQIQAVVSAPFNENSYIAWLEGSTQAVVFDPGLDPESILTVLAEAGLTAAAILNTHGHADHIAGNAAMKAAFPDAPLLIGEHEQQMLLDPDLNLSAAFGFPIISPPADATVQEGSVVEFAGIQLETLEIPGHSPGHVVFLYRSNPIIVFGGDVLFDGSIGRTDFPGGSMSQLLKGIREKLYTLPDDTLVYPGHGPITTTGREKTTNPFTG
jgi:hydroxyacylglutathione hydrolase